MNGDMAATAEMQSKGQDLASDFKQLSGHAEELLRATASVPGEGIALARQRLTESLRTAADSVRGAQSYARESARQAVTATDSYVHSRPWQAIALALVAGAVLGLMSRSTRN